MTLFKIDMDLFQLWKLNVDLTASSSYSPSLNHTPSNIAASKAFSPNHFSLGKLACPRVNDDQEIDVDDQKWNSGRPHHFWILETLFYEISFIFFYFYFYFFISKKKLQVFQ